MTNNIYLLKMMAEQVADSQNCVLEVLIGEEGVLAHLIPMEIWLEEDDEDD